MGSAAGATSHVAGTGSGSASSGVAGSGVAGSGVAGASVGAGGALGIAGSTGSAGLEQTACTVNTECVRVPVSCCGCSSWGPLSSFTAINIKNQDRRCALVDCLPCEPSPPPALDDPSSYFVATCQKPPNAGPDAVGRCVVVDLRATQITACQSATDCVLRSGTNCCPGCGNGNFPLVSINGSQYSALSDLVCGGDNMGCPKCAANFDGYDVACNLGRCSVEESRCSANNPCTE